MFLSKNKQFLNINISHDSLFTHLRCGGIFHNDLIANLPLSLSVKEFLKSVNICEVTDNSIVGCFFDSQCMSYFEYFNMICFCCYYMYILQLSTTS